MYFVYMCYVCVQVASNLFDNNKNNLFLYKKYSYIGVSIHHNTHTEHTHTFTTGDSMLFINFLL